MFEDDETGIIVRQRPVGTFRRLWPLTGTGTAMLGLVVLSGLMVLMFLSK